MEGESTQPVELPGANPFASDEVTETANVTGGKHPQDMKPTQPMRVMDDAALEAVADTLPPPDSKDAKPGKKKKGEKKAEKKDGEAKKSDDKADKAETKADAKPADDGATKKADEAKKDDAKPAEVEDEKSDGTPSEIGTADTGRVVVPSKDKDAG